MESLPHLDSSKAQQSATGKWRSHIVQERARGCIAVPACKGCLAETKKVPVTEPFVTGVG
eukprot:scaffold321962_cov13-Tisochrysis_lutea.AAC.1